MDSESFTFDDVLLKPKFSLVKSRKDVDLTSNIGNKKFGEFLLPLPIISSNMATITDNHMAAVMAQSGGLGIIHRFMGIEENIYQYKLACEHVDGSKVGVSIGMGDQGKSRAKALADAGATVFCIDVAHGAQIEVTKQTKWLREEYGNHIYIIAGNFATLETIKTFEDVCDGLTPDAYKVGIGPGSVCSTRVKTGVGVPQLSAILECSSEGHTIIADGGIKGPGDIAKALAAGAKAVMVGGLLAGTLETPGELNVSSGKNWKGDEEGPDKKWKIYRGSAAGDYGNGWKTSEGVETKVPFKGPVGPILRDIGGGLRSSFAYLGARTLTQFQNSAEFCKVSRATSTENRPHYEEIHD